MGGGGRGRGRKVSGDVGRTGRRRRGGEAEVREDFDIARNAQLKKKSYFAVLSSLQSAFWETLCCAEKKTIYVLLKNLALQARYAQDDEDLQKEKKR